jgi:predicted Zn-dependent peptidase
MVTTGKRFTPKEIERYIDAVTTDEIKRVATKYLWDKDVSDLSSAVLLYVSLIGPASVTEYGYRCTGEMLYIYR